MKAVTAAAAIVLGLAQSAAADPVRIVSGALVHESAEGPTPITLTGDSEGFTLQGVVLNDVFALGPLSQCLEPVCTAGSTLSLRSSLTEVGGEVTLRGQTYPIGGLAPGNAEALLQFDSSVGIPVSFDGGTLTAPFTFNGSFAYPSAPNNSLQQGPPLIGHGIASVTLAPWGDPTFPDAFTVSALRFDFQDTEPVPEPASLPLMASGLGYLAGRRVGAKKKVR